MMSGGIICGVFLDRSLVALAVQIASHSEQRRNQHCCHANAFVAGRIFDLDS
jgi:hypothetical protein